MDEREAAPTVEGLRAEIDEQTAIADAALNRILRAETLLAAYVKAFPGLARDTDPTMADVLSDPLTAGATDPSGTSTSRAVAELLQSTPGSAWLVSELVDRLREQGRLPDSDNPANAVRSALERYANADDSDIYKGRRNRDDKVFYVYDPDRAPTHNPAPAGYDPAEEPF